MPLIAFFLVFATGFAINNENAPTKVESFSDFKHAIEVSYEQRKPFDSGSFKVSKTGDFGND